MIVNNPDSDLCSGICWSPTNDIYSVGDDKQILTTSKGSQAESHVFNSPDAEAYPTCIEWFPSTTKLQSAIFSVAASDGCVYFISSINGFKAEKKINAHKGAILALKWNNESTAFLTSGEDGAIKIWSKSGMLRSTLVAEGGPAVISCGWAPNNDSVVYSIDNYVVVKSLLPSVSPVQWKAHDDLILKVDWNPMNGLIATSSEDGRYRVWDTFGRMLFSSVAEKYAITYISWCPNGEMFAVATFNQITVCDKLGCIYASVSNDYGSVFDIAWKSDGTSLACATGSGKVFVAALLDMYSNK